jgi:hypothetical protein
MSTEGEEQVETAETGSVEEKNADSEPEQSATGQRPPFRPRTPNRICVFVLARR